MAVWPHGSRPLLAPAVLSVRGAEPGGAAPTYTGIRPECRSFSIRGAVKLGINKHVFIAGVDHRILLACIFVPLTSVRSQVPGRCPLWGLGRNSIQMAFWGLSSRSSPPVQGSVRGHVRVCRPIPPPPQEGSRARLAWSYHGAEGLRAGTGRRPAQGRSEARFSSCALRAVVGGGCCRREASDLRATAERPVLLPRRRSRLCTCFRTVTRGPRLPPPRGHTVL